MFLTGGAGYAGLYFVRHLLASGARVRVLDSFMYGRGGLTALEGIAEVADTLNGGAGTLRDAVAMARPLVRAASPEGLDDTAPEAKLYLPARGTPK